MLSDVFSKALNTRRSVAETVAQEYDYFSQLAPQIEDDNEIRCVVLTGDEAGGAFSAGADLKNPKTHTSDSIAEAIEALPKRRRHQAMNLLSDFAKPLVAAVNGYAVGIGCIVTYCCDLIVASERAEWRLPQVALGILPARGGTVRLPLGRPRPGDEGRDGVSAEGRWSSSHRLQRNGWCRMTS